MLAIEALPAKGWLISAGESSYLKIILSLVLLTCCLLFSPFFWGWWGEKTLLGLTKGVLKYCTSNEAECALPDPEREHQTSVGVEERWKNVVGM